MRMNDFFNFVGTDAHNPNLSPDNDGIVKLGDGSQWKYIRDDDVYEQMNTGARVSPLQLDNIKLSFERG